MKKDTDQIIYDYETQNQKNLFSFIITNIDKYNDEDLSLIIKGVEYTLSKDYIKGTKNELYNIDKLNKLKKEQRRRKLLKLKTI